MAHPDAMAGYFVRGVITFAVSYVAWFHVARKLSAVSSGLSIMLVPVFGVTGGALILGRR